MKKLINILKDKTGSSFFTGAFIALSFLVVACICFEFFNLHIVSIGIRDSVQSAITTACTENYNKLYNGLREGYSGGYKFEKSNWSQDIDTGDIYLQLDKLLGTKADGEKHIKYLNNKVSYMISDLTVQITNTPFAPDNHDITEKFTGVAYITLRVPFGFGWGSLPPMEARIKVTSGYTPKF
jgi:hypothetical protein